MGLLVFAAGGVGDGIWHTIYGVEVGIDALLSPTHLLLFAGGLLTLWTPVRSSAARADHSPVLAIGAVALVTAGLVFFIQYLWYVPYPWFAQERFVPGTGQGLVAVQQFFGGAIAATVVLVGPLLLVASRWPLFFGASAIVWGSAAALEALAFSREARPVAIVALGGLAFDLAYRLVRPGPWRLRAAAFTGPAVLFAGFTGLGLAVIQESGKAARM